MKKTLCLATTLSLLALSALPALAADAADPAKALFEKTCSACHGFDRPLGVNKDKAAWEATVKRMQAKKPGHFTDAEATTIIDYLAKLRSPK